MDRAVSLGQFFQKIAVFGTNNQILLYRMILFLTTRSYDIDVSTQLLVLNNRFICFLINTAKFWLNMCRKKVEKVACSRRSRFFMENPPFFDTEFSFDFFLKFSNFIMHILNLQPAKISYARPRTKCIRTTHSRRITTDGCNYP